MIMTKLEQVIKALQLCRYDPDPGQECKFLVSCDICPYWNDEVGCREIDLFNDALELLKERQWVSVKDRLPDVEGYKCLVAAINKFGQKSVFTAFTGYGDFKWYTTDVIYMNKANRNTVSDAWTITHWMPLPSTKEGNEG